MRAIFSCTITKASQCLHALQKSDERYSIKELCPFCSAPCDTSAAGFGFRVFSGIIFAATFSVYNTEDMFLTFVDFVSRRRRHVTGMCSGSAFVWHERGMGVKRDKPIYKFEITKIHTAATYPTKIATAKGTVLYSLGVLSSHLHTEYTAKIALEKNVIMQVLNRINGENSAI